eukprot:scaffold399947_cov22-Prasinocladus_malaysianus.AAC.1
MLIAIAPENCGPSVIFKNEKHRILCKPHQEGFRKTLTLPGKWHRALDGQKRTRDCQNGAGYDTVRQGPRTIGPVSIRINSLDFATCSVLRTRT